MIPTTEQTRAIHAAYVKSSGMEIPYSIHYHYAWERFMQDFTESDVVLVCHYLRKEMRSPKSKLTMACLKFRNLVEDLPAFADHRAMAIASARRPVVDLGKAQVLKATHRPETPPNDHCAPISQHVAGLLARWKEKNL
jgi:hypothetical protein